MLLQVRDYVYICDNAYSREQIVQMEQLILSKLNFRLTVSNIRTYIYIHAFLHTDLPIYM
jgi:hypothetical protein